MTHLNPGLLDRAQRHLLAKAIAEFSHERLIHPLPVTADRYLLEAGEVCYGFTATRHALEHWVIDPASLSASRDGSPLAPDVSRFILDLAEPLGLPAHLAAIYLEEIAATLAGAMWKLAHHRLRASDLVAADYQTIEGAMTEGHPGFVANNGRIGFGRTDHEAYSPEAAQPVRLRWLAVRRSAARLSLSRGLGEQELYASELDEPTRVGFEARLVALGCDPTAYLWLPVHPWQWEHKVQITFAPDLARQDLVDLGEGPDRYQAQQSIRTFFNLDRPERHYVKTALAIQNMGFLRGLSPRYMAATPAINDWLAALVAGDAELRACGFEVLGEVAAIGYTGDIYHQLPPGAAHQKMLAALWRESPLPRLEPGERVATMASLLHRDADGTSLVSELIKASGRPAQEWLASYLRAYLRPVAHCLLAHSLAFMPHGENLILVLRDNVPVRVFMKDIGEEIAVLDDRPLPAEVARIRAEVPLAQQSLVVHTDVFDGFFRHLAGILADDGVLTGQEFWGLVGQCLDEHAADHPELADAVAGQALRRPEFAHSCLNRLQLRNTIAMLDLAGQSDGLMFAGTLTNPIADMVGSVDR